MVLVYRRDKNGIKYRTYEPAEGQQLWVKDPKTGREYKQPKSSKPTSSVKSHQSFVDHRQSSQTPGTGYRQGVRSPAGHALQQQDRFPGIIALEEREGKQSDKSNPTILDWAKNCPVTYAEKLKYDELNLPLWTWGYVSEILSSRTGMSPELSHGELESRLQHLLCVLQITLLNSEKTNFAGKGWVMASIYAKWIQQKLDRGLDTWQGFNRFGHDPHPSEMFAARTEADNKLAYKKKDFGDRNGDRNGKDGNKTRRLCTTWNNCEVERKCQYLLDNPTATRCLRKHECSYCTEKKLGPTNHQRRFCSKRQAAGDA